MFAPTQHDVRRFFCETFRKHRERAPLTPLEAIASDWIAAHPEYHGDLMEVDAALAASFQVEEGRTNPFLHLSMHLSITEQIISARPTMSE